LVARRIEEVGAAGPHPELDPLADPRRHAALTADDELRVVAAHADERLAAHRFHELRLTFERAVQVAFVRPEAGVFRPDSDDHLGSAGVPSGGGSAAARASGRRSARAGALVRAPPSVAVPRKARAACG